MILKKPKPTITVDLCPACGGTGKAVRPRPKTIMRHSVPDCPRCKGAGRLKPA
jgi:DnaJ-class molecular chaperone